VSRKIEERTTVVRETVVKLIYEDNIMLWFCELWGVLCWWIGAAEIIVVKGRWMSWMSRVLMRNAFTGPGKLSTLPKNVTEQSLPFQ